MTSNKLFCITGPTAAGKTDIAIKLAREYPLEIISVDSALIYRGMDIGTAKPSQSMLSEIPHHIIDIRDPSESYSVAEFCADVHRLVPEIQSRGKQPILVGGTMMYLNALLNGLSDVPASNPEVRDEISCLLQEKGISAVYERLNDLDPVSAQRLKSTDTQRIIRALEVFLSHGKPIHAYWAQKKWQMDNVSIFAICPENRADLHRNIAKRTDIMLTDGLVDEVQRLYERGDLNPELPSMRSVGYRQVWQMLEGGLCSSELAERITIATRQLAKRQLTWLRSFSDVIWLTHECAFSEIAPLIKKNG